MMPRIAISLLFAGAVLLSTLPGLAQEALPTPEAADAGDESRALDSERPTSQRWRRPGWYVGATGLYAFELRAEDVGRDFFANAHVSNSPGFCGRLGYQGEVLFAGEVRTEYATGFDASVGNTDVFTYDLLTTTLNLLLFWPGGSLGRFDPYGYVGVGFSRLHIEYHVGGLDDEDDYGVGYTAGFGLNLYLDEHWSVNFDLGSVSPGGFNSDYEYLSLGGGVRFQF